MKKNKDRFFFAMNKTFWKHDKTIKLTPFTASKEEWDPKESKFYAL